ncbi:MAG: hypothetical protein Q9168_003111 [Polycauliona sp. 1 TL-2023]
MSFGWSISDIVLLVQLAYKTSQGAKAACGQYDELTQETSSLQVVLNRLAVEAAKPGNPIDKDKSHAKELGVIASGCNDVLSQLDKVLVKYNALSEKERSVRRLWKKVRFGNGAIADVAVLRAKITYYTSSLTLFLNMVTLGTVGQIEEKMDKAGGDLQDIKNAVNHISAHLMSTAGKEGSVLTAHTDDDRDAWRVLRRRLQTDGFKDSLIREHMDIIMAYVKELGDRGVFDNVNPDEAGEDEQSPEALTTAEVQSYYAREDSLRAKGLLNPIITSQQLEAIGVLERAEQNARNVSEDQTPPRALNQSADVQRKLSKMYGYNHTYRHGYGMPRFVANYLIVPSDHDRHFKYLSHQTVFEVEPAVSAIIEAFRFRTMSLEGGAGSAIEGLCREAHRIRRCIVNRFDGHTKQDREKFLNGDLRRPSRSEVPFSAFYVESIRSDDAMEFSTMVLKAMDSWIERFDRCKWCRAFVDARWLRFSGGQNYEEWRATWSRGTLYEKLQVEHFQSLRFGCDPYDRPQTNASDLLKEVYQQYLGRQSVSDPLGAESNVGASYTLPAFAAVGRSLYSVDEVFAISDRFREYELGSINEEVRLLSNEEKLSQHIDHINNLTLRSDRMDLRYWTPNGLALLAVDAMLRGPHFHQQVPFDQIALVCEELAQKTVQAFVALVRCSREVIAAIVILHSDRSVSIKFTDELRSRPRGMVAITLHRFPIFIYYGEATDALLSISL